QEPTHLACHQSPCLHATEPLWRPFFPHEPTEFPLRLHVLSKNSRWAEKLPSDDHSRFPNPPEKSAPQPAPRWPPPSPAPHHPQPDCPSEQDANCSEPHPLRSTDTSET